MSKIADYLSNLIVPGGTKASATQEAFVILTGGSAQFTDFNYRQLAEEGYQTNVTVFACIRERATAKASLNWKVFRIRPDGTKVVIEGFHPLKKLLFRPNKRMSGSSFWEWESSYRDLGGDSFTELVAGGNNFDPLDGRKPKELFLLRPDRMKIIPGRSSGNIGQFEWDAGTQVVKFHPDRIMHRNTFNPLDDFFGFPTTKAAGRSIDGDNLASGHNIALLQNNGRPSGMLVSPAPLEEEQFQRIQKLVSDKFTGPMNAGRIMIGDGGGGLKWVPFGQNAQEMDWMGGRKISKEEICSAFGVPPILIGMLGEATYSNYENARKSFWTETMIAEADSLRDDININITPHFGDNLWVDYDKNSIDALQEDRNKVWERADNGFKAGTITANEARKEKGLPPADDPLADVRMLPATVFPATGFGAADLGDGTKSTKFVEFRSKDHLMEFKNLNLVTEEQKTITWKAFDRSREVWIHRSDAKFRGQLNSDFKMVANALVAGSSPEEALSLLSTAEHASIWAEGLKSLYDQVVPFYARQTLQSIKSNAGQMEVKQGEDDLADWLSSVDRYLEDTGAEKVTGINATTKGQISGVLEAGVAAGSSIPQIAAEITTLGAAFSSVRGERIARTEVIAASNAGSIQGAKSTGLPLLKAWLTTRDDRTRDGKFNHSEPDGQLRGLDDSFTVSGQGLLFPGDSSQGASAGNVINCRCTVVYQTSEGEVDPSDG